MSRLPLYIVDAFIRPAIEGLASEQATGNPAGVVLLNEVIPDEVMQRIAKEVDKSETAFVLRSNDHWRLRWFTPAAEVDLCGHATLATAAALWEHGVAPRGEVISFKTRSGVLTCTPRGEKIELNFPATPPTPAETPPGLFESLGVASANYVGRSRFDLLVELENEDAICELSPDMSSLAKVNVRGVIVTAQAKGETYDFVSRFFAPAVGVPEDPVTGSAHCCLAPYWSQKLGKTQLVGYQASQRGGVVEVELHGDRVYLRGGFHISSAGEISVEKFA